MKGKAVLFRRSWPYLIDDKQERHDLRPWIRGLCGVIAGLITCYVVNFVFEPPQNIVQGLLYSVVYGLMFASVSVVFIGLVCCLGKAGCPVFCREEKEEESR